MNGYEPTTRHTGATNTLDKLANARSEKSVSEREGGEDFSIIAINYYLLSLFKVAFETADHAGYHISPLVIGAVAISILCVKYALSGHA